MALGSIIVVDLAYTSYLGARLSSATTRSLQAEYLLKSAVNVARVMLKEDTTPEDAQQDSWGTFLSGQAVPPQLLGIGDTALQISMEITAEESKFPLRAIVNSDGSVEKKWRDAAARLFRSFGIDEDGEVDHTRVFPERNFVSEELVALLIDYMDKDSDSYDDGGSFAPGVESDIADDLFPNERLKRVGELASIPGFTPGRLQKLTPLITIFGPSNVININLAHPKVIQSLHEDISEAQTKAILEFRKAQPFDENNRADELSAILGDEIYGEIRSMLTVHSKWFQVLAKVDYSTSVYFMRAYISESNDGELPVIRSVELFY